MTVLPHPLKNTATGGIFALYILYHWIWDSSDSFSYMWSFFCDMEFLLKKTHFPEGDTIVHIKQ